MPYAFSHQERARHIRSALVATLLYLTAALTCAPSFAQPPQPTSRKLDTIRTSVDAWEYRAAAYDYASTLVQLDVGAGIDGGSLRVHPLWTVLPSLRAGFTVGASRFDRLGFLIGARLAYRMRMGISFGGDVLHSTVDETLVSFDAAYDMGFYVGARGTLTTKSEGIRGELFVGITFPFID